VIIDTLERLDRYAAPGELLAELAAFLRRSDLSRAPEGRMTVRGEELYGTVMNKQGVPPAQAVLEAHRRYTDLHLVLSGEEEIGWAPLARCATAVAPFDSDKDVVFFTGRPLLTVRLEPGLFALFRPTDAHAPLISKGVVRKVVFKLLEPAP
jgi:biofilm protein TabA